MKGRVILIDMPAERASQAALLVDGRLEDLLLDPPTGDTTPAPGEIYWAKVDRLVPRMHGAFVRLTPEHMGFLREAKGLKEGRGVLVQVSSYPEPGKATPVTPNVLYKGPRVIYTPHAPGVNVSRQIRDSEERRRLLAIVTGKLESMSPPTGGVIIRTAAQGSSEAEFEQEIDWVLAPVETVSKVTDSPPPLSSVATGFNWAVVTALREWAFPVPVSVLATPRGFRFLTIRDDELGPVNLWGSESLFQRIEPYDGPDLFDQYGVREEIERLKSPRVDLPSGGWMAVEATRAMVTVDVNTAAEFSGGAALTANIEAARELPRQLRLRGLGGQVIVDFAPLRKAERRRIEEALKAAFRRDPIETTLAGWTPLGHFELQRKRERRPLTELLA